MPARSLTIATVEPIGLDAMATGVPSDRDAQPRGRGETVLVVEDDRVIRELMAEILADAGYRTLEAGTGAAGLRLLRSDERIDLLVADVRLPGGVNGRQVAEAGRSVRPDLKILFVTGDAAGASTDGKHLSPGMDVLPKPFSIADLHQRVAALIDGVVRPLPS